MAPPRRWLAPAGAAVFFVVLALILTWPLVTVLASRYAGHAFSDSYEYARHMWWLARAVQTGEPLFFQPLLGYPDGMDGTILWTAALQSFPGWLLAYAMPLPLAFNLSLLARLALNGWAAFALARMLTGATVPALIAGTLCMAYPAFQGHLAAGHTGLLALWPALLYARALLTMPVRPSRRRLLAAALLFVLSILGSPQLLLYVTAPVTLLALALAPARRPILAAALLGGALSLVFLLPLVAAQLATPDHYRFDEGVVAYSADLLAVVTPSYMHPVYGRLDYPHRVLGVDPFEGAAYIGIVGAALAIVGVLTRRAARPWLVLAAVAWVFSLGPLLKALGAPVYTEVEGHMTGIALPWLAFHDLPVLGITRSPGRFAFALGLAVPVMAAYGAAVAGARLGRFRRARWLMLLLVPLALWDMQLFWSADGSGPLLPTVPGVVPAPLAALTNDDTVRAVLDVPAQHPIASKEGLWLQTGHGLPLIGGHVSRRPPVNPARLGLLERTLDPALLDTAETDVVIVHRQWDDAEGELEARAHERLGEPFYEDERFAAFRVPDAAAPPGFTALPPVAVGRDRRDLYLYLPEPGSVRVRATADAGGRRMTLRADFETALWTGVAPSPLDLVVALPAGFHTLSLTAAPACPPPLSPALACRALEWRDARVTPVPAGEPAS